MATITDTGHRLNHVEMVYRPGERALAGRVYELLGMRVLDRGGTWMTALVDPDVADFSNNACLRVGGHARAVGAGTGPCRRHRAATTPAWATPHARTSTVSTPSRNAPSTSGSASTRATTSTPRSTACARPTTTPSSQDASRCSGVFHPDEPGAAAPNMIQAFVRTDVVAAGLLAFGQHVELQWHVPPT